MSRLPHPHSPHGKVEHLQDFTSLDWCQQLLSDPSISQIEKRSAPNERTDVSNSFFKKTLFTDEAIRAYLSMYRASKAEREHEKKSIFAGSAPMTRNGAGAAPQAVKTTGSSSPLLDKQEYVWSPTDPDTPEMLILVSVGREVDGGIGRLHGGLTATLLDQVMGGLIANTYDTCATVDLSVKYKVAVATPCVLLCRGKMVRRKGRWIETVGWVEDGHGKVYAEGKGAFVVNKAQLAAAKM